MADTHYYIDTVSAGAGADDGSSPADAWQGMADVNKGMQYNAFNAATRNLVWVRRTATHTMAADIALADDGFPDKPIIFIGWPRPAIPNTTITEAEFTNGSNIVDNVVGITISRESHMGRFITAPDGEQYLLTAILYEADVDGMAASDEFTVESKLTNTTQTKYGRIWAFTDNLDTTGTIQYVRNPTAAWVENDNITDADGGDAEIDAGAETAVGFLIDRKYAGSTVTSTNGKFQIEADEDYDNRPAAGTSAGWDADAVNLVQIDGNSASFEIAGSSDQHYGFRNFDLYAFGDTTHGTFYITTVIAFEITGCLMFWPLTRGLDTNATQTVISRTIIEGTGAAGSNRGIIGTGGLVRLFDVALYNWQGYTFYSGNVSAEMRNVNFGVEAPNSEDIFYSVGSGQIYFGTDVHINGDGGYVNMLSRIGNVVNIENYQKILGNHKTFFGGGEYISIAVSGETPDPSPAASAIVMKITPNISGFEYSELVHKVKIPLGEINAVSGSQTFKFWLYNDTGVTLNDGDATADIYLQAEYVKSYDDTTKYTMAIATSTEHTIADAADAEDWDSLSVTINPAIESKVRLYLRISKYETDDIFIDPQVVIS